LKVYCWFFN